MRSRSLLAVLAVVASLSTGLAAVERDAAWTARMQLLATTMTRLLPNLTSERRFQENQKEVREAVEALTSLSHDIRAQSAATVDDPMIRILGRQLSESALDARVALQQGSPAYARAVLMSITQQCIACHTRTDVGVQNPAMDLRRTVDRLPPIERAVALNALRQFDRALLTYRGVIEDHALASTSPLLWRRAVTQALAIAIRTRRNPDTTRELVELARLTALRTQQPTDDMRAWLKSVEQWKAERFVPTTEAELFERAETLMIHASDEPRSPTRDAALVEVLRATSLLHDQLLLAPHGPHAADAMLLLGRAYQRLDALDDGALAPMYFSACIRARPFSETAAECFADYESSVRDAWSGSAGFDPPDDVVNELRALARLAKQR